MEINGKKSWEVDSFVSVLTDDGEEVSAAPGVVWRGGGRHLQAGGLAGEGPGHRGDSGAHTLARLVGCEASLLAWQKQGVII